MFYATNTPNCTLYTSASCTQLFTPQFLTPLTTSTHLQLIESCLSPTVVTPAGPKATLSGVLVHVLPQDHLPALLKCALHPRLGALVKVIMIVTVLPFPAAPLIWTGYMECVQLSGGSFVWKELHYIGKVDTHWNCISLNRSQLIGGGFVWKELHLEGKACKSTCYQFVCIVIVIIIELYIIIGNYSILCI